MVLDQIKIFQYGEVYYKAFMTAIHDSWSGSEFTQQYIFSALTMQAFACELYLKSIHVDAGRAQRGHELDDLFFKLPASIREEITRFYDSISENSPISQAIFSEIAYIFSSPELKKKDYSLGKVLKTLNDNFIHFRYYFEKDIENINRGYHLVFAGQAIRKYILSVHPDWPHLDTIDG